MGDLPALRDAGALAGIIARQAGRNWSDLSLDDLTAMAGDLDLADPVCRTEFTLGVKTAMHMTILPERLTVHGSLPGADVEVRGKRTHETVLIAANPDARKALTYTGRVVDFDNIWVCDLDAVFRSAKVPA